MSTCIVETGAHLSVHKNAKLIFFRDPTITADSKTDYWLAWEGNNVSTMHQVVYKILPYMDDNGVMVTKGIWVDINDNMRRWNTSRHVFVNRLTDLAL